MMTIFSAEIAKTLSEYANENKKEDIKSADYVLEKLGERILEQTQCGLTAMGVTLEDFWLEDTISNLSAEGSYIVQELTDKGYEVDLTNQKAGWISIRW